MLKPKNPPIDKISLILIIFLLLLRYPLLILSQFGLINNTVSIVVFLLGTYLCTGIFICKNIKSLYQYCISIPALILFLLSPIASIICNSNDPTALVRIAMAVVFVIYLYRKRHLINAVKNDVKTILPNCLITIACIFITTFLFAYIRKFSGVESPVTMSMLVNSLLFQFSFAAVMEEPLFRGFLWGSLIQSGLSEIWICVVQALLFWLGHIYYINTGLNFWVIIPIGSLVLGLIVMKTKSIAYSMATHTFMNSFGDIFQHFIKLF
jgi:membrane protease YdiL (CAAX protease family)